MKQSIQAAQGWAALGTEQQRLAQTQRLYTAMQACGEQTAALGLALTGAELQALAAGREQALQSTGRVEFGPPALPRIALAFCTSPYLDPRTYAAVLQELQALFYQLKNETGDRVEDGALLAAMRQVFDGPAGGSVQALANTPPQTLAELARQAEEGGAAWNRR